MRHPGLIPLSHDHHHGLALALRCRKQALGQLKPMGAVGLQERAGEVLSFYESNLIGHFRVEEQILFPKMRASAPRCGEMLAELINEHQTIHHMVEQLRGGNALAKIIFDLGDLLERHIRREERELFAIFEQDVEPGQADAIGAEIKNALASAQHPG